MNKLFLRFLQNHSQCSFDSVGTNTTQKTTVSVFPSFMHAVKNVPPLQPFEDVPSSTICGSKCFAIMQQAAGVQECSHKSVFCLFFNNWPSTTWAIMYVCHVKHKLKTSFSAGCTIHLVTRREFLIFWTLFVRCCWRGHSQFHFFSAAFLSFVFYISYNLFHVVWA